MKKLLSIFTIFCLVLTFICALDLSQTEMRPDKLILTLTLSQDEKSKATDFEVYLDNQKITKTSLSKDDNYNLTLGADAPLWPEQKYEVKVVLLNKDKEVTNITKTFETDTWAGLYAWYNPTNKDNKGKAKELIITVKKAEDSSQGGTYYQLLDTRGSDLYRVFPLEDINKDQEYSWHDYDEDSTLAMGYRLNAERFNTTSIKPSRFRVEELTVSAASYSAKIKSKSGIFSVTTDFDFNFRYNEETKQKELMFVQGGDSIVKTALFSNPQPPKEGKYVFILTQQN